MTSPNQFLGQLEEGAAALRAHDPTLTDLLEREIARQASTMSLVASCSPAWAGALVCEAAPTMNVTAEGYPGARYHAGCEVIDEIERLAIERAKTLFSARYANVQPMSATSANLSVLCGYLKAGDPLMGMTLQAGGHLTHGAPFSVSGRFFEAVSYGVQEDGTIDYQSVLELAREHRPRILICGATAYPRLIDFARFREIADSVGALLLADITHTAGLVAAGVHPNPVDVAHVTTMCTHKQLYGPRGGLIISGRDADQAPPAGGDALATQIQGWVFPSAQSAPNPSAIAAKAATLGYARSETFRAIARQIRALAEALAHELLNLGHDLVTGGTDSHIVLLDLTKTGATGRAVETALQSVGITTNKNLVPGDRRGPRVTSGLRLGTNSLAARGVPVSEMKGVARLLDDVIRGLEMVGESGFELSESLTASARERVADFCARYSATTHATAADPRVSEG